MTYSSRLLVGTLLALATSGCTIVADLDGYISADDIGCDMEMTVRDFTPHLTDRVLFQAVTRDDIGTLRAMAIIDPLRDPDRTFVMPNAIGEGAHAFNFWADVDDSGFVETSPFNGMDHSWRLEDVCNWESTCTDEDADLLNCFTHVAPFTIISNPVLDGNDFVLNLTALPEAAGFVEVHLIELDTASNVRRVVGLYRRDVLLVPDPMRPGGRTPACTLDVAAMEIECTLELEGLAIEGRRYTADVLVDLDDNGVIDGATEVFNVTESDGSAYANPVELDVSTADPAGSLPVEVGPDEDHPEQLVSPLPAP